MYHSLKKNLVILFLFFLLPMAANAEQVTEDSSVVFYPTDVTEAEDMAYLRDSLRLMLASRLASVAGGEVRLEQKMSKERDLTFYRVKSRLVSTANGLEISVEAFRPYDDKPMYFQSVAGRLGLIDALDMLVADMGQSLFSMPDSSETKTELAEQMAGEIDLSTSHPDKIFKVRKGLGLSIEQDDFIAQMAIEVRTTERFKSEVLPVRSKGMTAGDIDGDSRDEVLIATNRKLYIYQLDDLQIQHLETISLPGNINVHALNVADLNKNGLMEIYISSTRDNEPRSFVLEWSVATGVEWLYENVYWYLRPVNIPGEGMVLAGQKGGVAGGTQPGIYRMLFESDEKITGNETFYMPESINLFDFVFADLDGDKLPEIVTLDKKEQLKVYNSALKLLYTSPSGFGGRELSDGVTFPIRLVATDFDNDGKEDILVVDNELSSPKILNKTKWYRNGQVRGLVWDVDTFMEMWSTNLFPNSVADFQFLSYPSPAGTDVDMRGRLFVLEPETGDLLKQVLLGGGGSRLLVYGMDFVTKHNKEAE